jgi:hypothetical protein
MPEIAIQESARIIMSNGVNQKFDDTLIEDGESPDCLNIRPEPSDYGNTIQRDGYIKYLSFALYSGSADDQTYAGANQDSNAGIRQDTGSNYDQAQGFQVSQTGQVRSIQLYLRKQASPVGNLTLTIQSDATALPSNTAIATSEVVAESGVTGSYTLITFYFRDVVTLTSGTQYHMVLTTSRAVDAVNYIQWGYDGSSPTYANGSRSRNSQAAPTTWTAEAGHDFIFTIQLANSLVTFTGAHYYIKNAASRFVVFSGGVDLFDVTIPASPKRITGANTFTNGTVCHFSVGKLSGVNTLVITKEDQSAPLKWAGTGVVALLGGTPPNGKYTLEFFGYVFIFNTAADPNKGFWSAQFNIESWTTGVDFLDYGSEAVEMVEVQGTQFLSLTRQQIFIARFTGDSIVPFTKDRLDYDTGTEASRAKFNYKGVIYYAGLDGHIFKMAPNSIPEKLSDKKIPNYITNTINRTRLNQIVATVNEERNEIWFAYARNGESFNSLVLAVNTLTERFYFHDQIEIEAATSFVDSSGNVNLLTGDTAGWIYTQNQGDTDFLRGIATDISYHVESKRVQLGSVGQSARIRNIVGFLNNGGNYASDLQILDDTDSGTSVSWTHRGGEKLLGVDFVLGVDVLGGSAFVRNRADIGLISKYIKLRFSGNGQERPRRIRDVVARFQALPRL